MTTKWLMGKISYLMVVPYTVWLLLIGIGANWIIQQSTFGDFFTEDSQIGTAINSAALIDPHVLLTLFIPPLIFESAFSSSFHTITKESGQALLLALPGVAIAILVTAYLSKWIYNAGKGDEPWEMIDAFVFASMVSATDPVAVVALLGELGASERLGTLIEAESLFNDGSAYVFYMVFLNVFRISLEPDDFGQMALLFVRLSFGGIAIGLA